MKKFNHWQLLFDFILAALGIVILPIALGYGFGTIKKPGPGLYPFFLGVSLAISGALLFLSDLGRLDRIPLLGRGKILIFVLMVSVFCLWILSMPLLGYLPVTLLTTFAFSKIMKLEGWRKPLLISFGTTLFIYLMFDVWLYIDLPRGFMG